MNLLAAAYSLRAHVCALYALVFLCVYRAAGGASFSPEGLAWAAGVYLALQLAYLFNRLEDRAEDEFNGDSLRLAPARRRAALAALSAGILFLAGAALYRYPGAWPVAVYGLLVIPMYSWPRFPLKRFMVFKPLSVAAGVFLISFFLPLSLAAGSPDAWRGLPALLASNWQIAALFALNSVFLDMRDERGDALSGVVTVPSALGGRRAALLLAGLSALLAAASLLGDRPGQAVFAILLSAAYGGALLGPGREYYNHVILLEDALCLATLLL